MNLATTIELLADADDIANAVKKVFSKKTGKGKGYTAIGDDIRSTIIREARRIAGPLTKRQIAEIDDYLATRIGYMKNTFSKLNAPMKDKSDRRATFVGETEHNAAQQFGKTKGYEWSGRRIMKSWVGCTQCDDCQENMDVGPIPVDEDFPSGDYAPPAHPGCPGDLVYLRA